MDPSDILRQLRDRDPAVRQRAIRTGASQLPADALVAHLRDGADHVLRNAALEMLKARGAESASLAVQLLADADSDVVLQAVLLLDHLKDPRTVEPLKRVLKHANPNVVQAAIVALGHVGNAGVIAEIERFLAADLWLRLAAVEALGDLRCPEAAVPLARLLDDGLLGPVAAAALARIGGAGAFRCLAERWVAHQNDTVLLDLTAHVLEGLCEDIPALPSLGIALEVALAASTTSGRLSAARCLLALGASANDAGALELVTDALAEQPLPPCLYRRGDLAAQLMQGSPVQFGWGLRLSALLPSSSAVPALVAAMNRIHGHAHVEALSDALLAAEPHEALGAPLVALYARLPRAVRRSWGLVLHRHRESLRAALLDASLADAATRVVLSTVVEENPLSAAGAIAALPAAVRPEALAHAMGDEALLKALPWPRLLDEDPDECGRIAVAVADSGVLAAHLDAIRLLAGRTRHRELVRLLGRLRDDASVPLLASLARQGPDTVRPFALASLGAIGGAEARAVLCERAEADPDWARFAYRALADCRTSCELAVFRAAAAHDDWHVRMICAEVLAASGTDEDRAVLAALAADQAQVVAERARAVFGR